jgi:hypothetical protein
MVPDFRMPTFRPLERLERLDLSLVYPPRIFQAMRANAADRLRPRSLKATGPLDLRQVYRLPDGDFKIPTGS